MKRPKFLTQRIDILMVISDREIWTVKEIATALGLLVKDRGAIRTALAASQRFERVDTGVYVLKREHHAK
jgi:hypothetical protein